MSDLIERLRQHADNFTDASLERKLLLDAATALSQDARPKPIWPSAANPEELADILDKIDRAITLPVENAKLYAAANMLRSLARDKRTLLEANQMLHNESKERGEYAIHLEGVVRAVAGYVPVDGSAIVSLTWWLQCQAAARAALATGAKSGKEAEKAAITPVDVEYQRGLKAAWDTIDKLIRYGELTYPENERRNGIVLACNAVAGLIAI